MARIITPNPDMATILARMVRRFNENREMIRAAALDNGDDVE